MPEYTFRLDIERAQAKKVIEDLLILFDNKVLSCLFTFEIATQTNKPHIHGYLEFSQLPWKNEKAKQRMLKKFLEEHKLYTGTGCYSLTKMLKSTYLSYMTKDGDIIFNKNVSASKLDESKKKAKAESVKKKKENFPELLKFIEKNNIITDSLYNCQLAVIKYYREVKDSLPNSRSLLIYLANRVYVKSNQPTDQQILSICFGIDRDKVESRKEQIEEATQHLKTLQAQHSQLLKEVEELEDYSDSEDSEVEKLL